MKIPHKFITSTPEFIKLQSKFILFCAMFGIKAMDNYFDALHAREFKKDNKHVGRFLLNKLCEEFELSHYELFESSYRKDVTEARHIYCILAHEQIGMSKSIASSTFGRSKHLAKRAFSRTQPRLINPVNAQDKLLVKKYRRIKLLLEGYLAFSKDKSNKQQNTRGETGA